jgi:hypothetical protein
MNPNMRRFRTITSGVAALIVLVACGGTPTATEAARVEQSPVSVGASDAREGDLATMAFLERMDTIDRSVAVWRGAESLVAAQAAAEEAANLVVGPNGPGFGDRNGDGVVSGDVTIGLLPGLDGTPAGLASPLAANDCIWQDVLGSAWTDPGADWGAMLTAIANWRPGNNTMPTLASHPMRIVGWATFTLASDSLDEAREYAGHAKLHVDVSFRALDC